MKIKPKAIKSILKIAGSGVLVEHFDKNGDKKVTWREVWSAPVDVWAAFLVDIGARVASVMYLV